MAVLADSLLLEVLKACDPSAPLYPAPFAAASGLDRGILDEALDHLRLRGLVRFSDWVQGKGQGYVATPQGAAVLRNPRLLRRAQIGDEDQGRDEYERPETPWARGEAVRDALLNPARPVVCSTLLALNILMFVAGLVLAVPQGVAVDYLTGRPPAGAVYEELGALDPNRVLIDDQWWRLLGYAFVHGGLLHIAMNMYFLFSLGPLVETMWGSVRFLALYLVSAVVGGCAVLLTARAAIGASGALCGLLTSMGVWVFLNRKHLPPNIVSSWMRAIMTNVILIAVMSVAVSIVSWEGHLGGALGGALVSVPLNYQRFGRGWQKILGALGVIAVPVLSVAVVLSYWAPLLNAKARAQELHVQRGADNRPLTDDAKARKLLLPSYKAAEQKALVVYVNQAASLLRDLKEETDKARLVEARRAFEDAERWLREALAVFDSAGPFSDEHVTLTVQQAKSYLQEWSKFYAAFSKTIASPPPATEDQFNALMHQLDNVAQARKPLEDSALMPTIRDGPRLKKGRGGL